jgi:hypothetical protein
LIQDQSFSGLACLGKHVLRVELAYNPLLLRHRFIEPAQLGQGHRYGLGLIEGSLPVL